MQLTCVFHEFQYLLLALIVSCNLGDVLTKDVGTLVAEEVPQMLDEWLAEENETLFTAILKIDVKVVLLDAQAMWSKLVLDFLHKSALTRNL